MWNTPINLAVIEWLNQLASLSGTFNKAIYYLHGANLFKGIPLVGLLLFYWFREGERQARRREIIIAVLAGCLLALLVARLINNLGPFQPRPMANPALAFPVLAELPPHKENGIRDWSSFPSDHAALFFALAAGLYRLSRRVGAVVFVYVALFIALPRIYLGLHYPTDIAAGAVIGVVCVALASARRFEGVHATVAGPLMQRWPALVQTGVMLLAFQMAVLFNDVRMVGNALANQLF